MATAGFPKSNGSQLTATQAVPVRSAGFLADEILSLQPAVKLNGVTSQGIFLLADNRYVIFVSYGAYRAPLTLSLDEKMVTLSKLRIGAAVAAKRNEVFFPEIHIRLFWDENRIWHPPLPTSAHSSPEERLKTLNTLCQGVYLLKEGDSGFTPLLGILLNSHCAGKVPAELGGVQQAIEPLQRALREQNNDEVHSILEPFLGYGRGLTPSGDDFVAGILLALNRWPALICAGYPRQDLNERLIASARTRTTRLSINIIVQAAEGTGDERLLDALDNIMNGVKDVHENVIEISRLGHSSGADTLAGMAVVLGGGCLV